MNGKNLAPWNGSFGADVNTIPMEALQAVEVLKDGASATYGAGAVGGVINFRTRRDIDAPQISLQKQFYDGSDGYYKVDFLTGWVGDAGNLLFSASYSHEDAMLQTARDFSNQPFNINPAPWSLMGANPGQFQPRRRTSISARRQHEALSSFPVSRVSRTGGCGGLHGHRRRRSPTSSSPTRWRLTVPAVPNTSCAFPQAPFQSLVNENNQIRAYIEFNADITENM